MNVTLYLDPVCVKFLKYYYKPDKCGVYQLSDRSTSLYHLITRLLESSDKPTKVNYDVGGCEEMVFSIYDHNAKRQLDLRSSWYFLSAASLRLINHVIRERLVAECYACVFGGMRAMKTAELTSIEIKYGIELFMNTYRLTDKEIQYETLKKAIYRDRIRLKEGKIPYKGLVMSK